MVPSPEIQLGLLDGIALYIIIAAALVGGLLLSGGFASLAFALWLLLVILVVGVGWVVLKRGIRWMSHGSRTSANSGGGNDG